ncbi:E3 ubiquitin-protein ligase Praja-1-like isoform X1 [Carlito syrichta]|uniref:RING-type E3 ubiquitin transferase n=1 Tax=Carlito syrichta TaxID=1868482 RepID=A0A1U7T6U8_CARSF|nr:E3 ubiquitin-protein ligase Praja-1-like isoform X1 [Carlito syrichta]
MGQEASKPELPKPAGGYQSSSGRMYGRRHAYVSSRPSTSQQERVASQGKTTSDIPVHRSAPSQTTKRSRSPFSTTRRRWDDSESSGTSLNIDNEAYSRYPPREYRASGRRRAMAYGHADSYGADDSQEEGTGPVEGPPERGKTGKDGKLYESEKGARSLAGVPPQSFRFNSDVREEHDKLDPAPASRWSSSRTESLPQNGVASQSSSGKHNVATNSNRLEKERGEQKLPVPSSRASVKIYRGESISNSTEEPVVRPRIRNLGNPNFIKPKPFLDTDDEDDDDDDTPHSTSRWRETAYGDEGHSNGPTRRGRRRSSSGFSESKHPEDKREERSGQMKPEKVPRRRRTVANPDFWTYGDDYYRFFEDDSDSDTGWVTALLRKYRSQEETLSSSSKSWETLSGNEEREPQESQVSARPNLSPSTSATAGAGAGSTGPNYLEEAREPPLQEDDQASLEEGEIPWLQYNDNESSSEGDNDSGPGLMHPGVFMLDGNSNVEDDSSVSEDLDVDWSLFDGFADGPGVAEAISYVDPQFLTYMALEERLTQAMETALEHLESLAVDVEVANPPASKESIDALPKILVTDDHGVLGQDMCCPICCSEYVKGEVATELPCHHYFHKPCVSIWLQKSGTCPVCRCMYPPQL